MNDQKEELDSTACSKTENGPIDFSFGRGANS